MLVNEALQIVVVCYSMRIRSWGFAHKASYYRLQITIPDQKPTHWKNIVYKFIWSIDIAQSLELLFDRCGLLFWNIAHFTLQFLWKRILCFTICGCEGGKDPKRLKTVIQPKAVRTKTESREVKFERTAQDEIFFILCIIVIVYILNIILYISLAEKNYICYISRDRTDLIYTYTSLFFV